jgi:hypothetical protein
MVHLTVNSLNSLAELLREAKPLYVECQSIINDLGRGGQKSRGPISPTWQPLLSKLSRDRRPSRPAKRSVSTGATGRRQASAKRVAKPKTPPGSPQLLTVPAGLMARYRREELYNQVWKLPMRILAKEFGVSDVALAKTCKKLHIPVPGRGYWAKKAANQPVGRQPPLLKVQIL